MKYVSKMLAVLSVLVLVGCGSEPYPPLNPPVTPSAGDNPAAVAFTFAIESEDVNNLPTSRPVEVTINATTSDGRTNIHTDSKGNIAPGPYIDDATTPKYYDIKYLPPVNAFSIQVVLLGKDQEQVSCWVEIESEEVPGSRHQRQIIGGTVNGVGAAQVVCFFPIF